MMKVTLQNKMDKEQTGVRALPHLVSELNNLLNYSHMVVSTLSAIQILSKLVYDYLLKGLYDIGLTVRLLMGITLTPIYLLPGV